MRKFLPLVFLVSALCLFGIAWIVTSVDPDSAKWYVFAIVIFSIFSFVFSSLGLLLYFLRTRLYKRYSADWYIRTSFKMAFFVALFVAAAATLAIVQMVTLLNLLLALLAITLFAFWSYLGRKS